MLVVIVTSDYGCASVSTVSFHSLCSVPFARPVFVRLCVSHCVPRRSHRRGPRQRDTDPAVRLSLRRECIAGQRLGRYELIHRTRNIDRPPVPRVDPPRTRAAGQRGLPPYFISELIAKRLESPTPAMPNTPAIAMLVDLKIKNLLDQ
jgi:hypothetical protein